MGVTTYLVWDGRGGYDVRCLTKVMIDRIQQFRCVISEYVANHVCVCHTKTYTCTRKHILVHAYLRAHAQHIRLFMLALLSMLVSWVTKLD